ncbi:MAG: hypothetical protein JWR24_5103 [Actinoallomurus sp.]|jgi:hypothetical protein|nr:hypothetical protein [Actinoallomurus sp.]
MSCEIHSINPGGTVLSSGRPSRPTVTSLLGAYG